MTAQLAEGFQIGKYLLVISFSVLVAPRGAVWFVMESSSLVCGLLGSFLSDRFLCWLLSDWFLSGRFLNGWLRLWRVLWFSFWLVCLLFWAAGFLAAGFFFGSLVAGFLLWFLGRWLLLTEDFFFWFGSLLGYFGEFVWSRSIPCLWFVRAAWRLAFSWVPSWHGRPRCHPLCSFPWCT